MNRIILLLLLTVFTSQVSFAAKKRVLNLNGKEIADFSKLKIPNRIRKLLLSGNAITSIQGLVLPPKLKILDLDVNLLEDLNDLVVGDSLENLQIGGNPTINDYSKLAELNNLKYLSIAFNKLEEEKFDFTIISINIEELGIAGNFFQSLDLRRFTKLEEINMKAMFPFSRGATEFLLDYSKVFLPESLKILLMGGNDFGDQDFTGLALPENLEELDMATSSLNQEELATLKLPPNLKKLRLKRNSISSMEGIELPESLEVLNLQLNPLSKEEKQRIKGDLGKKVKVIFKCNTKCGNTP